MSLKPSSPSNPFVWDAMLSRWCVGMVQCPDCDKLASVYQDFRADPWLRVECMAGHWGDYGDENFTHLLKNKLTMSRMKFPMMMAWTENGYAQVRST